MAHQVLTAIGVEVTAGAVGRHYGARRDGRRPGRLAGRQPRRAPRGRGRARPGIACEAVPADDDRRRRHRRDGRRGRRARRARRVSRLEITAPDGRPGDRRRHDLARARSRRSPTWPTATSCVVTSKVVSKAEGRVRAGDRAAALAEETVRVVASRGPTLDRPQPARPHHGRGGRRRLQRRRSGTVAAAARSTPTPAPGRCATRSLELLRRQRGCRGHRHRRAGVARGPDRHRDRRRRAAGGRGLRRPRRTPTATRSP